MEMIIYYALAMIAVSYVLTAALAPTPPHRDPVEAGTLDFPQADEGTPQMVVFGDCWVSGWTILGLGNFRTTPIEVESGGGKK